MIFWNFTVFWYRSDSPQVKRNVILSITNLAYQLLHELPNDSRLNDSTTQPHGIFAAGGAFVPTQEKEKKKKRLTFLGK